MSLIDLIYPKKCVNCDLEGAYLCGDCTKLLVTPKPICPMCCELSIGGVVHPRCKSRWGIDRLMVGLPYKGSVQKLLKKVKYKSNWDIMSQLVKLYALPLPKGMEYTFVPMYYAKQIARGFNQAEMIVDLMLDNLPGVSRKVVLLERVRETKAMFGLSKNERRENMKEAFKYIGHSVPESVLICDDVWTTGATMRECTLVLKKAGVKTVWALALAR